MYLTNTNFVLKILMSGCRNIPWITRARLTHKEGWLISDSEALFRLCRGTNIITLLECDRISGHVPRLFILYIFSLWILILLVREKHRKILYRFLLIKNRIKQANNTQG